MLVTTRDSPSRGGLRDLHIPTTSPFWRSYQYRVSGFSSGSGMLTLVLVGEFLRLATQAVRSHIGSQRAAPWARPLSQPMLFVSAASVACSPILVPINATPKIANFP